MANYELYDSNYINEEISVSGWHCFVGEDVCSQINKSIADIEKLKNISNKTS